MGDTHGPESGKRTPAPGRAGPDETRPDHSRGRGNMAGPESEQWTQAPAWVAPEEVSGADGRDPDPADGRPRPLHADAGPREPERSESMAGRKAAGRRGRAGEAQGRAGEGRESPASRGRLGRKGTVPRVRHARPRRRLRTSTRSRTPHPLDFEESQDLWGSDQ